MFNFLHDIADERLNVNFVILLKVNSCVLLMLPLNIGFVVFMFLQNPF